jgi:hypothetical protein
MKRNERRFCRNHTEGLWVFCIQHACAAGRAVTDGGLRRFRAPDYEIAVIYLEDAASQRLQTQARSPHDGGQYAELAALRPLAGSVLGSTGSLTTGAYM